MGQAQTGADFGDEGDRRRKSVGGMGRRNGSFGLGHWQERKNWLLPWALEPPNAKKTGRPLHGEAVRGMLPVDREVIMEIRVLL